MHLKLCNDIYHWICELNSTVMEKNMQIEIMSSYFIQLIYMLSTMKSKLGVII